jgi:flagellar basal-body rod protein FlgC
MVYLKLLSENKLLILLFIAMIGSKQVGYADDPLRSSIDISASGMKAQQDRLRIIAENVANVGVTSNTPGGDPYQRKVIIMGKDKRYKHGGKVAVNKYTKDRSQFIKIFDPSHPAADKEGYVKYPNVKLNVENVDSRDASRSYEANLNMVDLSKTIFNKTLDILK